MRVGYAPTLFHSCQKKIETCPVGFDFRKTKSQFR